MSRLATTGIDAVSVEGPGVVGGGGAPGVVLPGWAVSLPAAYAVPLRIAESCTVVGRVERGRCLLDLRCVPAQLDEMVATAVLAAVPREH